MKLACGKKLVLLLVTISAIFIFVPHLLPGNCHAARVSDNLNQLSTISILWSGDDVPDTGMASRIIGHKTSPGVLHDKGNSTGGSVTSSIIDNLAIDFTDKIPEPSMLFLLGVGLIGFALLVRKIIGKR